MTRKERMRAAMTGGVPDGVPVMPQICHPHAIRAMGLPYERTLAEVLTRPHRMSELVLECARLYDVDGSRAFLPWDPLRIVEDDGEALEVDAEGRRTGRVDVHGGGWVVPFVDALKPYGLPVYLHICGNSAGILEMMADTGVDCIEPLDPLGGVEVADAKRRVGDRVGLMDGVNTVTLAHGSFQAVVEDCARCLREGADRGGYLLACGDMLPTETSAEKVKAMVRSAHEYGY